MSVRMIPCMAIALTILFSASANAAVPQSERDALTAFFNSTGGSGWANNSGWNGPAGTECTWFGVSCDATETHVISMGLENNNLLGTLPPLDALPSLQAFDVGDLISVLSGSSSTTPNQLTGSIPPLTGLISLQDFIVSDNLFTGSIPELAGLSSLQFFSVSGNNLTGPIPALTGLTNLSYFDASHQAPLQLYIKDKHVGGLTGSIPALTGLSSLRVFSVSSNHLTGPVPQLADLTSLSFFGASYQSTYDFVSKKFSGGLTGSIPSLTGTSLQTFDVAVNQLSGPIPSLEGLTSLQYFNASYNFKLSGSIPPLAGLTSLQTFNVAVNQLTGPIPSLTGLTSLKDFEAWVNQLSGPIPSLAGLSSLNGFFVDRNQLTGPIPSLTGLTSLKNIAVTSNQLTGEIPSLEGLTSLITFQAAQNQLTGAIPSLIGLTSLSSFLVGDNDLTGSIPALTELSALFAFDVSSNQLTGSIPSLTGLTSLHYLRVDSNQLTGSIPTLAGLTALQTFDVAFNQLTGSIPALTGLMSLQYFDVSNNVLTGQFPPLGGLNSLLTFRAGYNQIMGDIPDVPTPDGLIPGLSSLCPNALKFPFSPSSQWDAATGLSPWYSTCATAESRKAASAAPTTNNSTHIALSGDGRIKVFQSQQTDLTSNVANAGGQDIYSIGSSGQPVLESVDASGNKLIGTSSLPAISSDGKVVAFLFTPAAAKQAKDVITGEMFAGLTGQPKHQVDIGMGGVPPNGSASGAPSLSSANGTNQLVFCSSASNLVPNDGNNGRDIFLVDPLTPAVGTQRVSLDSSGAELPGDSCEPKLSIDGNKVVFSLSAPTLYSTPARQIVIKDLAPAGKVLLIGQMLPITTSPTGQGATADSSEPTVNQDGSVVAFTSQANLDGLGTPIGSREVFVSLLQGSGSRLIKRLRSGDGTVPDGASQHPQLSADGTTVVLQTAATNFLQSKSLAKALGGAAPQACGAVAITTNFFSVTSLGSTLCVSSGNTNNQNPSISGDGTTAGFDSNASQPGTGSNNSNAYSQGTGAFTGLTGAPVANLSGDFSGQWFDPTQSGQGLVIDVTNPDANNNRLMLLTWFVFSNGQPTWVQGVGVPKAGVGAASNTVVVQMDQVATFQGASFPLGEAHAAGSVWGSMTLTFNDANTGNMSWTSSYPGFASGSMPIKHFLAVGLPAQDALGAQVTSCFSGNWFNPTQSGHGFEFEVLPTTPAFLAVDWFAFAPNGTPVWLQGAGPISGNSAQMHLQLIDGSGAQFPPNYNPNAINQHDWGTATFTFTDAAHGSVTWNSTIAGYGSGTQPLQPLAKGLMDRRGCQ